MDSVLLSVLFIVVVCCATSLGLIYSGYRMGLMAKHIDKKATQADQVADINIRQTRQLAQVKAPVQ